MDDTSHGRSRRVVMAMMTRRVGQDDALCFPMRRVNMWGEKKQGFHDVVLL